MANRTADHEARRNTPAWILPFFFLSLVLPSPCLCQDVQGQLIALGTGQPLEGALVSLLDAHGTQRGGYLTNQAGRFSIRAPGPGHFTLRAERIGFEIVTSQPFELAKGQVFQIRLEMSEEPIQLEELTVVGDRKCVVRPEEGMALARIWDEVRKALTVQQWTEQEGLNRFRVLGYQRELDPETRLAISETQRMDEWATRNPIRSLPAEKLLGDGFIQRNSEGEYIYYGPDATVLLSDAFLDTHCFSLELDDQPSDLIGLSFEPVIRRSLPDISGTLWLDGESARLQFLEFGYTWSPWMEAASVAEGRVYFEELPGGSWIVSRWWIRMPKMVQNTGLMTGGGMGFRVRGITEAGGEVVQVSSTTQRRSGDSAAGTLTGLVWDSLRSSPLVGAEVYLSGTEFSATTDSTGRYHLPGIREGVFRVVLTHPRLDSLGVSPSVGEVSMTADAALELPLGIPSRVSFLSALCSESGWAPGTSAVVGTVRDEENGLPIEGATVVLEWTDYRSVANREILADVQRTEVLSDERGRFRACGVPSLVILTARGHKPGFEGPGVEAIVPDENVLVMDLTIQFGGDNSIQPTQGSLGGR